MNTIGEEGADGRQIRDETHPEGNQRSIGVPQRQLPQERLRQQRIPQGRLPHEVQTIPVSDLRPAPDRLRMFSMLEVIWQMSIRVDKER